MCPAASVAFWWTKTNVSPAREPRLDELEPRVQVAGRVARLGRRDRLEADRLREPAQERRLADERALEAVPLEERRHRFGLPHHFNVITLNTGRPASARRALISCSASSSIVQRVHSSAARAVRSASGATRQRPQHRMAVAEERVGVGDALVRAPFDAQDRLAAPLVREREEQPVDLEPVARLDERLRVGGVAVGSGRPVSQRPSSRRSAGRSAA